MTRVYAILAHPKGKSSLNGHIFYSIVDHLKKNGVTVDVLDLYQHADNIPFYYPKDAEDKNIERSDFFKENKERFMAADRILVVYPVYDFCVPAILKCWVETIGDYACTMDKYPPKALHKIKKAMIVNTAGMPNFYRWFFTRNSATETMKRIFKFIGIKPIAIHEIGSADKLTPEKVNRHMKKILAKADWLAK
jgi:putative NADPH-quinone reductase